MTKNRILIALLLLMALNGALDEIYADERAGQAAWGLAIGLSISFLTFAWYVQDRDERHYPRSLWLNIGILVATMFALPYYLVRSRPRGQKLRALLKCAGFVLLMVLATAAGMVISGAAL